MADNALTRPSHEAVGRFAQPGLSGIDRNSFDETQLRIALMMQQLGAWPGDRESTNASAVGTVKPSFADLMSELLGRGRDAAEGASQRIFNRAGPEDLQKLNEQMANALPQHYPPNALRRR